MFLTLLDWLVQLVSLLGIGTISLMVTFYLTGRVAFIKKMLPLLYMIHIGMFFTTYICLWVSILPYDPVNVFFLSEIQKIQPISSYTEAILPDATVELEKPAKIKAESLDVQGRWVLGITLTILIILYFNDSSGPTTMM